MENYFRTTFALAQHHKYSLEEIGNLIPWEREIYIGLLIQYIDEEKKKQEQAKQ